MASLAHAQPSGGALAAQAQPPSPALALDELGLLSAAPDAAFTGIGWRDGVRGRAGVAVPVVRDPEGWRVRIDGAIELYNYGSPDAFPYQYWRGMLSVRVGHRWNLHLDGVASAISLTGSIEHESDHESFHGGLVFDTFLYTDALAVRSDLALAWPELSLLTAVTARAHFATCTSVLVDCTLYDRNLSGSFELALDASARTGGLPLDDGNIRGCAAIHLGYVVPVNSVIEEVRAALDVGACLRIRGGGEWQLLGEARAGSELGLHRAIRSAQIGIDLRWAI